LKTAQPEKRSEDILCSQSGTARAILRAQPALSPEESADVEERWARWCTMESTFEDGDPFGNARDDVAKLHQLRPILLRLAHQRLIDGESPEYVSCALGIPINRLPNVPA
jgi:hypothetical protein